MRGIPETVTRVVKGISPFTEVLTTAKAALVGIWLLNAQFRMLVLEPYVAWNLNILAGLFSFKDTFPFNKI